MTRFGKSYVHLVFLLQTFFSMGAPTNSGARGPPTAKSGPGCTSYNLQVAGKAPKESPEWLKSKDLIGEKDRSIHHIAKESEDKRTVQALCYNLFHESKFLMQTIPLFDMKYSGVLVHSKYSSSLVR